MLFNQFMIPDLHFKRRISKFSKKSTPIIISNSVTLKFNYLFHLESSADLLNFFFKGDRLGIK